MKIKRFNESSDEDVIALNKNKFNINKTKYIIYPAPARILSRGSLKRVN